MEPKARENLLRLVAGNPDSALADFAKDVLAGRRELRDLAHTSVAAEEVTRTSNPRSTRGTGRPRPNGRRRSPVRPR